MSSFTAIDFETAQGKRWSICQVGLVRVQEGKVVDKVSLLVCPPGNIYHPMNTQIHGINERHTCNSPRFSSVWTQIRHHIENQTVVAHNSAFDFNCLKRTLEYYNMPVPTYTGRCTYKIYGENLATLCRRYNITLRHHDALSDAMACAELYKMHLGI